MKRSKFSDEQILAIVKKAKLGGRWPTCAGRTITEQTYYSVEVEVRRAGAQ